MRAREKKNEAPNTKSNMDTNFPQAGSKRRWSLQDEVSDREDNIESGMRLKSLPDNLDENMCKVVVACLQWPQIEQ